MIPKLPRHLADQSVGLPNVYFCTVLHSHAGTHSIYLAADDSVAAIKKLNNYCAANLGFRPYRTTTDIKLRRFLLGDYLDNPQGLLSAMEVAQEMGERSTVKALEGRMAAVQSKLQQVNAQPVYDFEAVADALSAELRRLEMVAA